MLTSGFQVSLVVLYCLRHSEGASFFMLLSQLYFLLYGAGSWLNPVLFCHSSGVLWL